MLGRVLGRLDHDAPHRAGDGAQLATDALLQPIGVAMQDMTAALARRDRLLPLGVFDGDDRAGIVLEGGGEGARDIDGTEEDVAQPGHQALPWKATNTT